MQQNADIRVMLVEDDFITREDIARRLRPVFGQVLLARDGGEGLETYRRARPQVVVSDIRMPNMDGLEMCRAIKAMDEQTYVVLASAFGDEPTLLSSIDIGVDKFIKKPIVYDDLMSAVRLGARRGAEAASGEGSPADLIRRALDRAADYFLITDGRRVHYANRSLLRLVGAESPKDLEPGGRAHDGFLACGAEHREELGWLALAAGSAGRESMLRLARPCAGELAGRRFLMRVGAVEERGGPSFLVSLIDVTRLEQEKERYLRLSERDPLTGAFNRAKLQDELGREIARAGRYGVPLSLIMLDIDDFKGVNDTYGHQVGDEVLVELSRVVAENIRGVDLLARYGGEEFFVLATDTGLAGAASMAEKLRRVIAEHDFPAVNGVTCSFGVAQLAAGEHADGLIRRVDVALYRAKAGGKNRLGVCREAGMLCAQGLVRAD